MTKIVGLLLLSIFFQFFTEICFSQEIETKIALLQAELDSLDARKVAVRTEIEVFKLQKTQTDLKANGLPELKTDETVVEHSAMSLVYSEEHEQAKWVAHIITPDILQGGIGRTNDFRTDPKVKTGTAVKSDYWYSGYDRGHLAPSADFRWSHKALSESYFYSNMSPQLPELNREIWAELESFVREYVAQHKEQVYVVTGGVLKPGLPTIGKKNKVSIPELFYKVIADIEGDTISGIAFLIPNAKTSYPLSSFAVSIDSIENLTKINFFPKLPDEIEDKIEANYDIKLWQSQENKGNVTPIHRTKLPENTFNTVQARSHIDEKGTVCGTVVSVKFSKKSGNTFINLDQKFPKQIFWCTIWKSNIVNFTYDPATYLINKKICVTGNIKLKYGHPSMSIRNEKAIKLYDDLMEKN